MLNHVRTLLLNREWATAPDPTFFAEEAVPEGFTEINLSSPILAARAMLFGSDPDRQMLNFRLRNFMTLLHASPLVDYVLALDRRFTYKLGGDDLVTDSWFTPTITKLGGAPTDTLEILGSPEAPDPTGRMFHRFIFDVGMGGEVTVTQSIPPPYTDKSYIYTLPSGLSDLMKLTSSGYSFRLNTTNVNAAWMVEILNRPQWDMGTILANLDTLSAPTIDALLGITAQEPFATFRRLWFDQKETPLRLGAMLLAVAYRTDARRLQNG